MLSAHASLDASKSAVPLQIAPPASATVAFVPLNQPALRTAASGTQGKDFKSAAECIQSSSTAFDVATRMERSKTNALLVIDSGRRLVGIVTDKDLVLRVIAEGLDPHKVRTASIMTPQPQLVREDELSEAALLLAIMQKGKFSHLPVVRHDGAILGMVHLARCLAAGHEKIQRAGQAADQLATALERAERELAFCERSAERASAYNEIRKSLASRTAATKSASFKIDPQPFFTVSNPRASIQSVAQRMKQHEQCYGSTSAVLICPSAKGEFAAPTLADGATIISIHAMAKCILTAGFNSAKMPISRAATMHSRPAGSVSATATLSDILKQANSRTGRLAFEPLPVLDKKKKLVGHVELADLTEITLFQLKALQQHEHDSNSGIDDGNFLEKCDNDSICAKSDRAASLIVENVMPELGTACPSLAGNAMAANADIAAPSLSLPAFSRRGSTRPSTSSGMAFIMAAATFATATLFTMMKGEN